MISHDLLHLWSHQGGNCGLNFADHRITVQVGAVRPFHSPQVPMLHHAHFDAKGGESTFAAVASKNGGTGYITKAQALWETTALTPGLTLYIFNATPTSELDDNKGNAAPAFADLAQYVGLIEFPSMKDSGGMSEAIATPSTVGNLPLAFECATDADDLICILVTRDAITGEQADEEMTVRLTIEQN